MANPDNMGYSITNTKEDLDNFFLIPYLEEKFDELEAMISANAEVDSYVILDEEEAKKAFTDWFNAYLDKYTITPEEPIVATEVEDPAEDLADVLENL